MTDITTFANSLISSLSVQSITLILMIVGLLVLFWRIQKSKKLDFTDMLTKNGTSVSLTKVLQLVGGITSTWVIVNLALNNTLSESLFGLYLAYVGSIEAYSKFVAARYNYSESSVNSAVRQAEQE